MISYSLHGCLYPEKRIMQQEWSDLFIQLTEHEMRMMAKAWKFNPKSVEKLITHKNKKFRYIKKKGYEIVKTFHNDPVEYMSSNDPRQPQNITIKKMINDQTDNKI